MLSKKQARAFFLGGTVVTFLIFIGLTIFSLAKGRIKQTMKVLQNKLFVEKFYGKKTIVWVAIPF